MTESFRTIVAKYRFVFFDAYGVLKNFSGIIDGVPEVISRLKEEGKELFVVTNDASRSPEKMSDSYGSNGTPMIPPERFISSGMIAHDYLVSQVPYGKIAYLGKPDSAHYIEMAGFQPIPMSECTSNDKIVAIALMDDEGFDWFKDINAALNMIRRTNVPVIVANADMTYPMRGNNVALAIGSLGDLLSRITEKTFIRFGKPDTMMFAYAFTAATKVDPNVKKSDILFVGDTLRTDILGASQFGLDTVLVLSGNTLPENAELMIRTTGIRPTHICESIAT
ncbi:MAG: HAD-IIA family hydrolase [Polyangiales bacterium]